MQSAEVKDGWPVGQTSDGAIAWDGTRASVCFGCQSYGCHHGFWLRCCFGHRPAGGRDLLRHPASTELSVAERGIGGLGTLLADKGFEGEENHRRWLECYGVRVIYPPKRNSRKRNWPKRLRRWVAGYARSSRRSTTSSSMPLASGGSGPMSWKACELAWRRG